MAFISSKFVTSEEASAGVGVKIITWIYTFVQLVGNIFNNEQKSQISKTRKSHRRFER